MRFSLLFSPINLGTMSLKNRVVMSPMLTNFSDGEGRVNSRHLGYYGARARGGVGLITVEGTAVAAGGRGFPAGLGCWDDSHMAGLAALAGEIHRGGAKAMIQLSHAGRQTVSKLCGAQPVAPSPIPCPKMREMPKELSRDEIREMVEAFARGTRRAREAGFDAVELHGGHGYLINQFLSPYSNHRLDEYGGDLRGRTRFAVEIIGRIRELAGEDYPVLCRISADEFVPGGIEVQEAQRIARILEGAGLAAIDVSGGVYGSDPPTGHPHGAPFAVFSHLAQEIKASVSIPVMTVGRITRPALAEQLLKEGKADLIALGRALIADPEWTARAEAGRPEDILLCVDCNACNQRTIRPDLVCLVNPLTGREDELAVSITLQPKRVAVVGGGITGLIAARMAAERGHQVVLYQQGTEPGGLLGLRGRVPHLSEWTESMDCQARQASVAGVETRPDADLIPNAVKKDNPDVVIVALPGPAIRPPAPALPAGRTFTFDEAMSGDARLGQRVVVVGGGIMGTEAAYLFASHGKDVTIIDEGDALASDAHPSVRYYLLEWMREVKVRVLNHASLKGWSGDSLQVSVDGKVETVAGVDSIVLALGYGPAEEREAEWKGVAPEVYFVGDPYEAHQGTEMTYKAARVASDI